MQGSGIPVTRDLVLVGAGHSNVAVLRKFGMAPLPGVRVTLITREVHTPYSGMLPGLIAGHYDFDDAHIDTGPLARFAGARLYQDEVVGIDSARRLVLCRDRPPVAYDLLSLNLGSVPNTRTIPGAAEYAIPVKPIDRFLAQFDALRQRVIATGGRCRIAMVGAGAGGVELLLSLERRLRDELRRGAHPLDGLSFVLVSDSADLLPSFPAAMRAQFRSILAERAIALRTGARVTKVEPGRLLLDSGEAVDADEILWVTQAAPPRWLGPSGLPLDESGFLRVEESLQIVGQPDIYAAGDMIAFATRALPKSGVFAVRAGPVLAENLRRRLTGRPSRPFKPQKNALYLISTGERYAVGSRNGITFAGRWVWYLKDLIDRRFMRRFNQLPEMDGLGASGASSPEDAPAGSGHPAASAMRCGGCGAKVGASVLAQALEGLEPAPRGDVVLGLDAPDDSALVDNGGPLLSIHTVDYFRAMLDDPYLFGKIAANHALGDIYAMGGHAQTALAIATIPYGLERKVAADLSDMMAGANAILREADCALVGGHTSEGAELALGFAVNGLVARADILRKNGLVPGDSLILTKPLGTGTLLAADMHGKAKARWIMSALAQMIQSNRAAADILRQHGVHGATDVTGFGLLGHLHEMVRASAVDAIIDLDRIPILDGADRTIAEGIVSSLQPQNLRIGRQTRTSPAAAAHPNFPLLFDPQTAGGLIASVPPDLAGACVDALRAAGYAFARVIGTVAARSEAAEQIRIETGRASDGAR